MSTALVPTASAGPLTDPADVARRLLDAFLRGRSAQTARAYRSDLADFATFCGVGSVEAALGMAVLAAAPQGQLGSTADRMVRSREHLEPDARRGARFAAAYGCFCDALVERGWLEPGTFRPAGAAS